MPISQWHRTSSSSAANIISSFLILKKKLKSSDQTGMHLAACGHLGSIEMILMGKHLLQNILKTLFGGYVF